MNVTGIPYFKVEVNYEGLKTFLSDLLTSIHDNKASLEASQAEIMRKLDTSSFLKSLKQGCQELDIPNIKRLKDFQ